MLDISIVQLDLELAIPTYARSGDAGVDLVARVGAAVQPGGGRMLVPTGIAIAIPAGYAAFVVPRSGLALHHGITVVNAPGLIDCAYRDEIKVIVLNTDPVLAYHIHRGDRIAQLVIQRVEEINWQQVEAFDDEGRGGGFGHSGR